MKKITRLSAMLLALCVLLSACGITKNSNDGTPGTSNQNEKPTVVGDIYCKLPLVKDKTSLDVLISGYENIDAADVFVWKKIQGNDRS